MLSRVTKIHPFVLPTLAARLQFFCVLQLVQLPATPNVVSILESYVKNYAVSAATSSCIDRPARLTRSGDDEKQSAVLENK